MRYICRGLLVLSLFLLASLASADDLTTTSGKKLTGTLVAVEKDGVSFKIGDGAVKVAGKDIVLIDLGHKPLSIAKDVKYQEIELTDGSKLRCAKFSIKKKALAIDLMPGPPGVVAPTFDLPLSSVFYACRNAQDAKIAAEWKKMLPTRGKRDLYVVRQQDGLNFVQGTLIEGNAEGNRILFEKEDGTKEELLLSRATGGLVFNQPLPAQAPPTVCKVNDVFGNVLLARSVDLSGSGMKLTTVAGVVVNYPSLAAIAQLDYARGNIAYLSDLTPKVDAPELPPDEAAKTLNVKAPYLVDKAPANAPLRMDGIEYPKGLWVPADTVLTYTIAGEYREFKATVGILDQVGDSAAETTVTIEADGRAVFSDTIRRKDKPKGVTLDVKNVKELRIVVEASSPFFNGSQAVLADARVQK
ncbi:MAG TPA: NPCBM/NEW2 domain-containing protein [Urbifossiella sp.]|nr:NPCBM/NEW2 domain-containing protein [Urbifossiella sp.]